MKRFSRGISWLLIFLQLATPMTAVGIPNSEEAAQAQVIQTAAEPYRLPDLGTTEPAPQAEPVSYIRLPDLAQTLQAAQHSSAQTIATGAASSAAETWLNRYATTRLQLNVDDHGNWDSSSLDVLYPLYDTP